MSLHDQIDAAVDNERVAYDRKLQAYHIVMAQRLPDGSGVPNPADVEAEQCLIDAWIEAKARLALLLI